jgi:hypothetical protein
MDEVRAMGFRVGLHSAGIIGRFCQCAAPCRLGGLRCEGPGRGLSMVTQVKGSGVAIGAVWRPCWPVAWITSAAPRCIGTDGSPRLLRLAQRLQANGVKRFAVQMVRTAACSMSNCRSRRHRWRCRSYGAVCTSCSRLLYYEGDRSPSTGFLKMLPVAGRYSSRNV